MTKAGHFGGAVPTSSFLFFFFNDTATTEIYTLSLHDALPILQLRYVGRHDLASGRLTGVIAYLKWPHPLRGDRKSTRLNSSHGYISYAVFCLKKKIKLCCIMPIRVYAPASHADSLTRDHAHLY